MPIVTYIYIDITVTVYDNFCNILKLENIKLLADYISELWNTRKSILL